VGADGLPLPEGEAPPPPTLTTVTTTTMTSVTSTAFHVPGGCLCLFDIDRTLTAKPGELEQCQITWGNVTGIHDDAFGGGTLVLSRLSMDGGGGACAPCKRGVISANPGGNQQELEVIAAHLGAPHPWSFGGVPSSPLVVGCARGAKHRCAKDILDWYLSAKQVLIRPEDVYFFDDEAGNLAGFEGLGMNARQVSCGTRDGDLGLCGGHPDEIVLAKGVAPCR
jgi:hypothetical protein